jgi:rod shape-determining protein MreC
LFNSGFKRTLVILTVVAVLCLVLAHFVPNFIGSPVTGEIHEVLAPVQGKVMLAWRGSASLLGYIAGMRRIQDENNQLKQQIRDLTWENDHLQGYVSESQQLEELLNFKKRNALRFTLLGARVISRSPANWYSALVVDRGSQDGVKKDMVVVSDTGLVGRVDAVWSNSADILPLLNPVVAVGATVNIPNTVVTAGASESAVQGVIEGNKEDPSMLQMIDLPYNAKLQPGEIVMTSGLGGIFPSDLPIGKVLQFNDGGSDLNQYALVQPDVDFSRLEDVFIITETRSVPESVIIQANSQASTPPVQQSTAPSQAPATQTHPQAAPTHPQAAPTHPQAAPTQPSATPSPSATVPTQPTTAVPTQPTTAVPTQPTTAVPTQPTTLTQ